MTRWANIDYREFWDRPRIFLARDRGTTYLFDCPFNEDIEDYAADYEVYLMPELSIGDVAGAWAGLFRKAIAQLGTIPVNSVRFDPTYRQCIDASALDSMVELQSVATG